MPRTGDVYTHSQFETLDTHQSGNPEIPTIRCLHCKTWTVSTVSLGRKKTHLTTCPAYLEWREAGNGQEMGPVNPYNQRVPRPSFHGTTSEDQQQQNSDQASPPAAAGAEASSSVLQQKRPDLQREFEDSFDDERKCTRSRCRHCGYKRAKNTTRQIEHLLKCPTYLAEKERRTVAGEKSPEPEGMPPQRKNGSILRGNVANPHLSAAPRPHANPTPPLAAKGYSYPGVPVTPNRQPMAPPPPPGPTPSLVNHLLSRDSGSLDSATQLPFLSHAGCGTLSAHALCQWLSQDAHISRAFVTFIGRLLGKMRLPDTAITMENTIFRTMDLLISTLNNVRREMNFFDNTASKYGLQIDSEDMKPATKGFIDLFASASSSGTSLLEGLVLLWATEHCYRKSWHYASTFTSNNTSGSNYSLPSFMTGQSNNNGNPFGPDSTSNEAHINALHQALIPNWTSPAFSKFVDACRSIVDEVANGMTQGNGRQELQRCEATFAQALWLWKGLWPEVNGMGESDEVGAARMPSGNGAPPATPGAAAPASVARSSGTQTNNTHEDPIEIQDDDSAEPSAGPEGVNGTDTPI